MATAAVSKPTEIFFLPHFLLASALALQGLLDQAKAATETGLLYFADFTIRRYRTNAPSNNQASSPNVSASMRHAYRRGARGLGW
jgi:hypothetical protein